MILPGKSLFNPPKPKSRPVVLPEPEPIGDEAEAGEARKKQLEAEKRRKGRLSTIVTGGSGAVEDPLGGGGSAVSRPRSARVLG